MQLMPQTAKEYGMVDPFSSAQSIGAGARFLKNLMKRYRGDLTLVAAAYNAGIGTMTRSAACRRMRKRRHTWPRC